MLLVAVPIFAKKKQKWWSHTKEYAIYGPGLRFGFCFTCMRTVRSQTGTKVTCVGSTTEMKSDWSEFIFRPVPCKRMKRNVWRPIRTHTGLSSSHSAAVVYRWWAKPKMSWALPWKNWTCREQIEIAVSKLKLPWHFWAIVPFKQDNKKSIYLDLMKNTNHRRIVAKFRTSNHKLMILIQEILHAQNSWAYQIVSNTVLK